MEPTHTDNPDGRAARFVTMGAVYALERISRDLDAIRAALNRSRTHSASTFAEQMKLDEAANELAQHADALATACGWTLDTAGNMARLKANPSTR